jgi:hypothetical protein
LCKCARQAAAGIWRAELLTNGVDLNGMCPMLHVTCGTR